MANINAQINTPKTVVAKNVSLTNIGRADLGVENVTNESKATMFTNPTFTGIPVAPTAATTTNTTQIATTAFVQGEITSAINTHLASTNDLGELADVVISTVANDDIIAYDSSTSKFINKSASELGFATLTNFNAHTSNQSNPHNVTATQLGLGAVTNESKASMFNDPQFITAKSVDTFKVQSSGGTIHASFADNHSYIRDRLSVGTDVDNTHTLEVVGLQNSFFKVGNHKSGLQILGDVSSFVNSNGQDTGIKGFKLQAPYFISAGSSYNTQFNLMEIGGEVSGSSHLTHLKIGTARSDTAANKPRISIGTDSIFVKEDGKVGVGTTDPASLFHISTSSGNAKLIVEADTDNDNDDDNPFIILRRDGGLEESAIWSGSVGNSGTANDNSLNFANATRGLSAPRGGIKFLTTANANEAPERYPQAVERMTITPDGKVGIGTNTPFHNLHVKNPTGEAVITIESQGHTNAAALEFYRTSSAGDTKGAGSIYVDGDTSTSAAKMKFGVGHNIGHGVSPKLTIEADGNVGIGTEDPSYRLEVVDDVGIIGDSPSVLLQKTVADDTHEITRLTIGTDNSVAAFEIQTRDSNNSFVSNDYRILKDSDGATHHRFAIGNSTKLEVTALTTAITGNATVSGDLTVSGTTTTVNQTNVNLSDSIIGLNRGLTGTNVNDSGIIIERGSSGNNAAILWDESADRFIVGTTTSDASASGNISVTPTGMHVSSIKIESGPTLEAASNESVSIANANGYIRVGAQNSSFAHFYTDRDKFYFEKKLIVDEGIISSYADHDLILTTGTSATASSNGVFVQNSTNKVGIHTNAPTEALDVNGITKLRGHLFAQSDITVGSDDDSDENIIYFNGVTGDANKYHTVLAERLYDGDDKSELLIFKGNDMGSSAGPDRVRVRTGAFEVQTYTNHEKYNDGLSDNNTRFHITNDGRIGVGTATPNSLLTIDCNNVPTGNQRGITFDRTVDSADGTVIGSFIWNNNGNAGTNDNTNIQIAKMRSVVETTDSNAGDDSGGHLEFYTKENEGPLSQRLIIRSNGRVGIGTSAPLKELDVSGSIAFSEDLVDVIRRNGRFVSLDPGRKPTLQARSMNRGLYRQACTFVPPYLQEESTDGTTFTTSTQLTDNELKDLVLGEGMSTSNKEILPNNSTTSSAGNAYYRLTWDAAQTGYLFINSMFVYAQFQGESIDIKVEAQAHGSSTWRTIAQTDGVGSGSSDLGMQPGAAFVDFYEASNGRTYIKLLNGSGGDRYMRVTFHRDEFDDSDPIQLKTLNFYSSYGYGNSLPYRYDRDGTFITSKALRVSDGYDVKFGSNDFFFDHADQKFGIGTETPESHFSGRGIDIVSPDNAVSEIIARGTTQGSGRFFAGQGLSYGGGFHYDGDGNPDMVGSTDNIVFFRRSAGTDHRVFEYAQNSSNVNFYGDLQVLNTTDNTTPRISIGKTLPQCQLDIDNSGLQRIAITSRDNDAILQLSTSSAGYLGDDGWTIRTDQSDSDKLSFRYDNSTKFTMDTGGRFGFGTTTPDTSYKVTVSGSLKSTGNIFQGGADLDINNDARRTQTSNSDPNPAEPDPNNTRRRALVHEFGDRLRLNYAQDYTGGVLIGSDFYFKNDGKLGINTGTPLASLDVRGPNDNTPAIHASGAIQIENSKDITPPSSRAYGYLSVSDSDTMIGGNLRLDDSVTGTTHNGYASGTNLRGGSGIKFTNITGGGADGSIIFLRQNDSDDDTWTVKETARFNATGLFGVGTNSPNAQIHAKTPDIGSTQGSQSTQLQLSGLVESGANSKLLFQQERIANSTGWQDVKNKIVKAVDGTEMGYISFGENTGTTGDLITFGKNTEEHMRIRSDGNVGIGTNSPTKKLLVENSGQAADNCVVGIVAGTDGYAALDFGDSADRDRGTIFYDNTDDTLNIQAGDNIGIELDASKRVGLNSLQAKNYHPDADELVIGKTSGHAGMTIRSQAGYKGNIFFADLGGSDTSARYRGIITYDHNDEQMVFSVNGEGYLSSSDANHSGMVIGANGVAIVPATDSSSNVSITEALQVTGNITATGNVTASGNIVVSSSSNTNYNGTYVFDSAEDIWYNNTNTSATSGTKGYFFYSDTANRWQFGSTNANAKATGDSATNTFLNPSPSEAVGFWSTDTNTNWTAGHATVTTQVTEMVFAGSNITATGNVTAADPSADEHLTTKRYVDGRTLSPTRGYESLTLSTTSDTIHHNTSGGPLYVQFSMFSNNDLNYLLFDLSSNSDMSSSTRIAQTRIISDGSGDSGGFVSGIVPHNWYWRISYSGSSQQELSHTSFRLA